MEFSDSLALRRLIPITKIVAISATAGCDAAQLALDGGADLVPLKMAAASNATKRVLVVGYLLLDNYTGDDCNAIGINTTDAQFCKFHKDNPSIAKVISPGSVLTCCASDHGGLSVITYNAPTDGGQSGSPVFDADTLAVIGVHYCCSTASTLPSGVMDCAVWHPQNVKWNEAISSQSLINDVNLKGQFSDVGSVVAGASASLVPGHGQIEVGEERQLPGHVGYHSIFLTLPLL